MNEHRDPEQQGGVSGGSQGTGGISGGDDHGRQRQQDADATAPSTQRDGATTAGRRPPQGTERGYDEAVRRPDDANPDRRAEGGDE